MNEKPRYEKPTLRKLGGLKTVTLASNSQGDPPGGQA